MTAVKSKTANKSQIRALMEERIKSVRAKDIEGRMPTYAPDVLLFDVVNPPQYAGADALRKHAEEWVSLCRGPMGYEIRNLSITAGVDVAFCHCLNRVTGTMTNGKKIDM